jgi:hypothetical protein
MSWWDYGYQMAAMGNKNMGVDDEEGSISVVVDNNTWNNTHIAAVGAALVSPEDVAWQIMDHIGEKCFTTRRTRFTYYMSEDATNVEMLFNDLST